MAGQRDLVDENGAIGAGHLPGGRSESKVYSASAANLQIPHRRARVAGVILPGSKLERIDEQGNDDLSLFSRQLPGPAKQGGVGFVQGAHRGNQDHPAPRSRSNVARSFRRLDHLSRLPARERRLG